MFIRASLSSVLVFVCLLAVCKSTFATTAIIPADRTMVVESRAIVTGQVVEVSAAVDPATDLVYTYVTVNVEETLKGNVDSNQIVLKELGGEASGKGTLLYGQARFETGQRVVLYLDTWNDGALRVRHGFIGKFDVQQDATGREVVVRQTPETEVHVMSSLSAQSSESDLNTFKSRVRQLLDENSAASEDFQRRHYNGMPLRAMPVEINSIDRSPQIRPYWAVANTTQPVRWFEPDSGQAVSFYLNTANAPLPNVAEDIQAAMAAWSTAAGAGIRLNYAGETSGYGVMVTDGRNTISFNNADGYFKPSSGCDGLLAVSGIIRYTTSQMKTINGRTFAKGVEANVSFNPYLFCWFTNRCQIQEVATHELGHAIGLGHSGTSSAVMAPNAHFDNRCASLTDDDRAGVASIYPGNTGGGSLNISGRTQVETKINVSYGYLMSATGGSGSYSWSIASGSMAPGLTIAPSGFIFGTPTTTGNYQVTIRVRDNSGNTSDRGLSITVQPPPPAPLLSSANYSKKKLLVNGNNFEDGSTLYVDGERVSASFDGASLLTKKKKLTSGNHTAYVVNYDGKESNRLAFNVE